MFFAETRIVFSPAPSRGSIKHKYLRISMDIQVSLEDIPIIMLSPSMFPPLYASIAKNTQDPSRVVLVFNTEMQCEADFGPHSIKTAVDDELCHISLLLLDKEPERLMHPTWLTHNVTTISGEMTRNDSVRFWIEFDQKEAELP